MCSDIYEVRRGAGGALRRWLRAGGESRVGDYQGELPEFGLTAFLAEYGHRGRLRSMSVYRAGRKIHRRFSPRWPAIYGSTIPGPLPMSVSPEQRLRRKNGWTCSLAGSAQPPLRAAVAGFMLRRSRALAGLRQLPTFVWLYPLGEIRRQLLLAGEELADRGTIHEADDVMFLTLSEAAEAAAGMDYRAEAASRRAEYERETRRRRVPGLVLSDGTMPEALPYEETLGSSSDNAQLIGMVAAAGTAPGSGSRRPRIERGEYWLTRPPTPGTHLFLTDAARSPRPAQRWPTARLSRESTEFRR